MARSSASWHIQSGDTPLSWSASGNENNAAIGGTGADAETGGTGNDMLIGLGGSDTLVGGEGADLLIGGEGSDQLKGDAGNDWLYGGAGTDTYQFNGNYGNDSIQDYDGQGSIQVNDQTLPSSAKKIDDNVYRDKATGWRFTKIGIQADGSSTLIVQKEGDVGNSITIHNWKNNQLGISLEETKEDPAPDIHTFIGDQRAFLGTEISPSSTNNTYRWDLTTWQTNGTLSGGKPEANFNDVIYGLVGADKINGLGGNDAISGGAGNDTIDGGAGDDLIGGSTGSDVIHGGNGRDVILSATGLTAPQRVGPDADKWAPPSGKTVYIAGSTWGCTRTATV